MWTARRKWLGNIIPACFWLPLVAAGLILMARQGEVLGAGLYLLVAGTAVGWFALNGLGLFENARMKGQLGRILEAKREPIGKARFVGFATPSYSSALDPHEDVGFLIVRPGSLRFVSETRTVEIDRADVREIRFRPNAHALLGLGRWVSVEGEVNGKPIRLLIEPRERRTLLGNRRLSKTVRNELAEWLNGAPSP